MRKLMLAGGLMLAGCAAGQSTPLTVAQLEVALTGADQLAFNYATLPVCPIGATTQPSGALCQDPTKTTKIKADAQVAHDAIKAAQANSTSATLAAANAAFSVLSAELPASK